MPLAAAQRIRNLIFGSVLEKAVWIQKIKNGRKTSKEPAGRQSSWGSCPLLRDVTDRANPQNR